MDLTSTGWAHDLRTARSATTGAAEAERCRAGDTSHNPARRSNWRAMRTGAHTKQIRMHDGAV